MPCHRERAQVEQLAAAQLLERLEAKLDGDERLSDCRAVLRAGVTLDLRDRDLRGKAFPLRPITRHRVVCIGDD